MHRRRACRVLRGRGGWRGILPVAAGFGPEPATAQATLEAPVLSPLRVTV